MLFTLLRFFAVRLSEDIPNSEWFTLTSKIHREEEEEEEEKEKEEEEIEEVVGAFEKLEGLLLLFTA
ncbi:hypothetical protein M0804_001661 [Polistes exclamans]|nr:hypothetical protein M0804_001661 [Polistes exclamans]